MRRFFMACLLLSLSFTSLFAADFKTPTHEFQLENGLKVIVREDHRAPVVFSSVWYKVGSSYESLGTTGISHALEHLMFRGTSTYGPGELVRIINANGGLQNAMTTNDYTVYYQFLPATKLAISLQLEADRMHNLLLTPNDFSKEIQVVMEERRMNYEDNPQSMTWILLNAAAHLNSPDQHPTIGWMNDLQQMQVGDVRQWYHHWYGPNNAVLVIVGDVNPEHVKVLVQRYFAPIVPIELAPIKKYHAEPFVSQREVNVRLPAKLPWVILAYNVPSLTTTTATWQPYALKLLSVLLGSGDSSRLAHDLVRQQRLAVDVDTDYDLFRLFDSLLVIDAVPTMQTSHTQLKQALLAEVKTLQQQLVSQQELDRAKAQFMAQFVYDKDSMINQAMLIGNAQMVGLSWHDADHILQHINAITPEQIQQVARLYLQPNRLTTANLIPSALVSSSPTQGATHEHASVLH